MTVDGVCRYVLLLIGLNNLDRSSRRFCGWMERQLATSNTGSTSWAMEISSLAFTLSGTLEWRRPHWSLGREIRVFQARLINDASGKVYAITTSWPVKKRASEMEVIGTVEERLRELLKDMKFRADNNIGDDRLERIPSRHWNEDVFDMDTSTGVRNFIEGYEVRVHRVVVFDMLYPIYESTNIRHFMQAYRDIFQGMCFSYC